MSETKRAYGPEIDMPATEKPTDKQPAPGSVKAERWDHDDWMHYREAEMEKAEANARLIAAAPDLLKSCKDLLFFCENMDPKDTMREIWEAARAAIAKATGKE